MSRKGWSGYLNNNSSPVSPDLIAGTRDGRILIMKYTKSEITEAMEYLHQYLKPGDKVYTILRQVSRSGMSRHISVLIGTRAGDIAEQHNI